MRVILHDSVRRNESDMKQHANMSIQKKTRRLSLYACIATTRRGKVVRKGKHAVVRKVTFGTWSPTPYYGSFSHENEDHFITGLADIRACVL